MTQIFNAMAKARQEAISQQQQSIRQFFRPVSSPYYYISYSDFLNNFQVHAGLNFKHENLHIIDTHLKYRQWCYEEMAPYKWVPILAFSLFRLFRLKSPPLILPYLYTELFDYYMEPFFVWKNKDQKVINMRYQFVSKLSKVKNKQRRVKLWNSLEKSLKRTDQSLKNTETKPQAPHKYIKFGFPTEYVFHAESGDGQMSTVLQTTFFQNFVNFMYPSLNSFKQFGSNLISLRDKFLEFKKDNDRKKYMLDLNEFKKFNDIKENEWYLLSTNIQQRVRRWLESWKYDRSQKLYYSNWTMDKLLFMYEHKHLTEEPKYNIEQNAADLCIYYAAVLIPTVILKFFKR